MEKIWYKSYPASTPHTIDPDAYSSLIEYLQESIDKYPNHPAVENMGTTLTYKELHEKSLHLAAYFQKHLNLVKGDRLAIMLPNVLQYQITLLAALRLGVVIVNINPLYTERELLIPLKDSKAKAIVVLANFASTLAKVVANTNLEHIIVTEVGDIFPPIKRTFINSVLKYIKKMVPPFHFQNTIHYREALIKGKKESLDQVSITPQDTAFLQYTGGTTGKPKGAVLTNRNLVANVTQCIAMMKSVLEEGKEVVITALPLYHIFSLTVCCFIFMRLGGLSVLITNPRDIKSLIKKLANTPLTFFVGVNTLYEALLRNPAFSTLSFKEVKITLAGGMAVLKSTAEKWQKATNMSILMGYGLTEASPVVTINPPIITTFSGSIGLPIPSTDIAILDDDGNELPIGSSGELCVKGPQVMQGYWNDPEETKQVFSQTGWLRTGDIAEIDEKGYVYLIDRKKDMILVSGFNVYPIEVEDVIASHPGVAEVAVIGVHASQSGESVKAFIVKKDPELTEEEIRTLCKEKLTGYKRPHFIEFCTELPKSNVGKILKEKLREDNK